MRYFYSHGNSDRMIVAAKFLIEKKMITHIELDALKNMYHYAISHFIYLYSLYMSGDIKALEEIRKLLYSSNILDKSDLLRIMIEDSDEKILEMVKKYILENLENNKYVHEISVHFNDILCDIFIDKKVEAISTGDALYDLTHLLSLYKSSACVKDLICLYKKTAEIEKKRDIIKYMRNCVSYEVVSFLLDIIYTDEDISKSLVFDALARIYNQSIYDEYINKNCEDKAERLKIINIIMQNKEKLKQIAIDTLDKNQYNDPLALFNLLFSICDFERDKDCFDKNIWNSVFSYNNGEIIFRIITPKIFNKENSVLMLEYMKTGKVEIIEEMYKKCHVSEFFNGNIYLFFKEKLDEIFLNMLDVMFAYHVDCLLDYMPYIVEHRRLKATTKLHALRIASRMNEKKVVEFLESYINKNHAYGECQYFLFLLYELDKTKSIETAKNIINTASISERDEFDLFLSVFVILLSQNDASLLVPIFDLMIKECKYLESSMRCLFQDVDKETVLKSLAFVYNKNKDISEVSKIINKCGLDFIGPLDIYNYILLNSNEMGECNSMFKLVNNMSKDITKGSLSQGIIL
ncbi:MAG: hypothetical protein NZM04_09405 [Methylacidiphilales bacterium]|nr:hypothetical protein [Candidatus Methylacidiphilales bacterium]